MFVDEQGARRIIHGIAAGNSRPFQNPREVAHLIGESRKTKFAQKPRKEDEVVEKIVQGR